MLDILEIEKPDASVWENIYRNIMWNIAKGVLSLLDGFFGILNSIWKYQFFNNEYVTKLFQGAIIVASTWLVLKVMIEFILNHIVKNDNRESPLIIYRGVVLAIVMMFLITPLFDFGHKISTSLTNSVITVSGISKETSKNESTISNALIRSMVYKDKMDKKDIDYLVKNWKDVDITKGEGGTLGIGDSYTYSINLFMLVVLSILTVFLLFFVAIQLAKRVMEIALFKIIGPFCCTGLTNHNSKSFETWSKSAMGLFLITVVQFASLGLMINMFSSAMQDNGTLTGIFLIIGALLFIINTPTIISSLLGQQSGLMTAFGDIQSMMAMGHGVSAGLSVAGGGLATAVSVVPKTAGFASGVQQQFVDLKNAGNSNTQAMAKTLYSQAVRPFNSIYQRGKDGMKGNFDRTRTSTYKSSPFLMSKGNPYDNPHSVQFNPVRNQYQEQSQNELVNRRWY